ncbi:MAG: SH3 domain-containing protein [Alphaproteobacteria bacterium]
MKYEVLLVAVAFLAITGLSVLAQGATISGFTNASAYVHAGPGQDFPTVAHVPPGANVGVIGCTTGVVWCDIVWDGNRGWISDRFLGGFHDYSPPKVVFEQRSYWRNHYRSYAFYSKPRYWPMLPAETPAEVRATRYNGVEE